MDKRQGQQWTNLRNGLDYQLELIGEMKLGDGKWVRAITYISKTGQVYTRDEQTFDQKFKPRQNPRLEGDQ